MPAVPMSAYGYKQTCGEVSDYVRLTPKSGHSSDGRSIERFPVLLTSGTGLSDTYSPVLERAVEKRSQLVEPLAYHRRLLNEIRRRLYRRPAARVRKRGC